MKIFYKRKYIFFIILDIMCKVFLFSYRNKSILFYFNINRGEKKEMNKSELIKVFAEEENLQTKSATLMVDIFFNSICETLIKGGRVEIRGFGTFKIKEYGSYAGRNPKTGEQVLVAPKKLPLFRPGKEFKNFINS